MDERSVKQSIAPELDANEREPIDDDTKRVLIERIHGYLQGVRSTQLKGQLVDAVNWASKTHRFELTVTTENKNAHFPHADFAASFGAFHKYIAYIRFLEKSDDIQQEAEEIVEDELEEA